MDCNESHNNAIIVDSRPNIPLDMYKKRSKKEESIVTYHVLFKFLV